MFGKNRVRRAGSFRSRSNRRSLERRIRRLGNGHTAASAPPRVEKFTAVDEQETITSEGIVHERDVDAQRKLGRPQKKIARLIGKLDEAREHAGNAAKEYAAAVEARVDFAARFARAAELLAKRREAAWKYLAAIVLGLSASAALDYLALSYLAPDLGPSTSLPGAVNWMLENLAVIGTVCVASVEALTVKYAGREAAWGFSPFVRDPTADGEPDAGPGSAEGDAGPVVFSDRTTRSHKIACVGLILALVGVIVALVALRELALNLLNGLSSGGSAVSGLAAPQASSQPTSGGTTEAIGLFVITAVPLLAAGWAAYLRESPLVSSLADLTKAEKAKYEALKKAIKRRNRIEAKLVKLGITVDLIEAERDVDQHLARLAPRLAHAVMVEAHPELFGVVTDEEPPFLWPTDDLATPYPRRRWDIFDWLSRKGSKPPKPETASTNGHNGSEAD
jgi:hypothetical protein